MLNTYKRIGRPVGGWLLAMAMLACGSAPLLSAADIHLPLLKIGTDVFTNATVYQMTDTDIFVRHERGFGNAKISMLDDESLLLLGLKTQSQEDDSAARDLRNQAAMEKVKATLATVNLSLPAESAMLGAMSRVRPSPQLLLGVLALMVVGYLFGCYCLKLICVNAGSEPGVLVWIPVLQMLPLVRAARMPTWWFVIFLIPGFNLLAHVLWSLRIAQACRKGSLVAVLLILPVTNIFALLYLAFSSGKQESVERTMKPEDLPGLAEA